MSPHFAIRDGLAFGDIAIKGGLILVAGWLVTLVFRKASAASRHLVWLATFCGMLLLPLLMVVVPSRPLAVLHEKPKTIAAPVPVASGSFSESALSATETSAPILGPVAPSTAVSPKIIAEAVPPTAPPTTKVAPHRLDWGVAATFALSLWLLGAAIVFLHWLWGVKSVRTLKTKASHIAKPSAFAIDGVQLTQHVGLKRRWELRVSATPKPPTAMTWGLWRPVVLLPQESVSWTHERLEAVLLHELAHVRRLDSLSQLISVAACALYWFNPAVWLGARALRAEAEQAADDTVIRVGIKPSDYARELLRMATDLGHRRQPLSNIGVPVMKQSKIEARVKSILDPTPRSRRGITLLEALATIGVAGLILLPLTAFRAALVSDPVVVQSPIASISTLAVPIQPTLGLEQPVQESLPVKVMHKTEKVSQYKVTSTKLHTAHHTSTEVLADISDSDVTLPAESPSGDVSVTVKQGGGKSVDQESKAKAEADAAVRAAAAAQNQVQIREAKLDIERLMSLYKAGVAPVQDVDAAKAKLEKLAADYQLQIANMKAQQAAGSDNAKLLAKVRELMTVMQADQAKMAAEQQVLSKTAHLQAERQALKALAEMKRATLSQIDSKEMRAKIREAMAGQKAAMMAQEQAMRETQEARKAAQSDVITQSLKRAKTQVAQAMRARERTQRLYQVGAISKAEAERVTNALKMAQIQLDLAQKILNNVQQKH